jgi:hypothetical protein
LTKNFQNVYIIKEVIDVEKKDWEKWAEGLNNRIAEWLKNEARETEEGYFCKRCGNQLMARIVYCPIHDYYGLFKIHTGSGEVYTFEIPECPNEKCPNHHPSFWDEHLRLDGNTLRGPCIDY